MTLNLNAMDENKFYQALAMFETDCPSSLQQCKSDFKIGKHGEISRYQIKPKLWPFAIHNYNEPLTATLAAKCIMNERLGKILIKELPFYLESPYHLYILWNAPAYIIDPIKRNKKIPVKITKRAQLFKNLYNSL